MTDANSVSVATAYFAAWNAGDLDRIAEHLAPDFVYESDTTPLPIHGRKGMLDYARMFLHAFPDLNFRIDDIFATDEKVTVCWTATGTHQGEIFGTPGSGRHGEIRGCSVARIAGDVLTEMHSYWDLATLLRQIGAVPARNVSIERERPLSASFH